MPDRDSIPAHWPSLDGLEVRRSGYFASEVEERAPRGPDGHLVELAGVRKSFGDNLVLDDIDLRIDRGAAVVVAGPSGSGKSTMLRCINGLEPIDEGSIRFDGRRVESAGRDLPRLRRDIGMVFQAFNLFPHMTVEHNVMAAPVNVLGLPTIE